jgi:hypothetical protein
VSYPSCGPFLAAGVLAGCGCVLAFTALPSLYLQHRHNGCSHDLNALPINFMRALTRARTHTHTNTHTHREAVVLESALDEALPAGK